jgi:hypothetical protein
VFGEFETPGDFAVGEAFGQTSHNIDFPGREQRSPVAGEVGHGRLSQGFEHELEFGAAGPDLTRLYALNALSEQAEGFGPAKDSLGASAERFDDGGPLGRVEQHDHPRRRRLCAELAKQIEPSCMIFAELRADHYYLRFLALDQVKNCCRLGSTLDHLKLGIASESLDEKLGAHGSAVGS